MDKPEIPDGLREATRVAWHSYIDLLAVFRPELHRYCRGLTGNLWDAEDLVQDTLLKGFATLGLAGDAVANPRGYLVRIATHLWIDQTRHRRAEAAALEREAAAAGPAEPAAAFEMRVAGRALMERLAPQERAALVLKEVFDYRLAEIAETLSTSVGAVKSALHRARERLADEPPARRRQASSSLVDEFVRRLDASDLEGLLALMLDTASIEMAGGVLEVGRREFERKGGWLWQAVNAHPELPPDVRPPKWANERVMFDGEPIVLGFMPTPQGRLLQGITRLEEAADKIARIRSYCFSPETAAEVAERLGLKVGQIPYRFPMPGPGAAGTS